MKPYKPRGGTVGGHRPEGSGVMEVICNTLKQDYTLIQMPETYANTRTNTHKDTERGETKFTPAKTNLLYDIDVLMFVLLLL